MEKPNSGIRIVKTIPIGNNRREFELFIIETQESLPVNQYITLPLKKVQKVLDRGGEIIKVLETEVNIKGEIRIIEIL